jgi:hypothetical protein
MTKIKKLRETIETINEREEKVCYYVIWFWKANYWIIDLYDYWRLIRRWTAEYLQWFIDWLYYRK